MLFASSNQNKIKEIENILNCKVLSLNDIEEKIEINENQNSFLENAILKVKEVYKKTGIPTIAEDSGLEIPILNGFPGVLTKRFLGPLKTDSDRNQEILRLMKNQKRRTCYFTSSFAYYDGNNLFTSIYKLKGQIAEFENINNGFGFDSIFLYHGKFLSNMSLEEKNEISPRKFALMKLQKKIQKNC